MKIREYPARQVVPIPGSTDILRLVEYADFRGTWPNLFRLTDAGDEVWASAPGGADAYTEVVLSGVTIKATTHYGRERILDLETGEPV